MNTKFDCDIVNGLSNAVCGRVDLLEKMLGVKVRENLRYSDIQKIIKSGFAEEFFDIGDEIMTTYTATDGTEYDFPWLVVDFRDVYWENDPNPHPGMVLQSKYATVEGIPFDAPERILVDSETEQTAQENWYYFGHTGNSNMKGYTELDLAVGDTIPFNEYDRVYKCGINSINVLMGYNNWKQSNIRQWLNKNALAGEWWESQHFGDRAPNEASTYNSFIYGLNDDFVNIINSTQIKTAGSMDVDNGEIFITYDKFWLPSREEVYANPPRNNITGIEGSCFRYWKNKIGTDSPINGSNSERIIMKLENHSSAQFWGLRSVYYTDAGSIFYVNKSGSAMTASASSNPYNYAPCCVIS